MNGWWIPPFLFLSLFLVSCGEVYDFERGYREVRALDEKYGTALHSERIPEQMVSLDDIDALQEDLRALLVKVNTSQHSEQTETVLHLIQARIHMLESQRMFQHVVSFGIRGFVSDGFECGDAPSVVQSMALLQKTVEEGALAQAYLDRVLQETYARPYMGIDETKPKFYHSPLREFSFEIRAARELLNECKEGQAGQEEDHAEA